MNSDNLTSDHDKLRHHFKTNYEIDDHLLSLSEIAERYHVHIDLKDPQNSLGLSESQIPQITKTYGRNILSPPKEISEWRKFIHHLLDLFNILLLFGVFLSFLAYILDSSDDSTLYLGSFLLTIVLFDSIIGYMQERSSSNVMGKFKKMFPQQCTIIRDGTEKMIQAVDLVVGDLIKVQGGNKVPADLRIIYNRGLKVEQSALNGESEPVQVSERSVNDHFIESRNIIFNGCLCLEGNAYGVAIKTGDNTYLGIIAQQTAQIQTGDTPLQIEIKRFVKFITILGVSLGTIVFIIGGIRGTSDYLTLFVQGFIIVIIANIPQGLPATVVSCLTIIAYRLSKQNVYIKKLESVETLGVATVIASDKTGTLTMNQMTVEHIWFDSQIYSADFIVQNESEFMNNKSWHKIFKIGVLCNKAFFQENKEEKDENNEIHENLIEKNENIDKNLLNYKDRRSDEKENVKKFSKKNSATSTKLIRKVSQIYNPDSKTIDIVSKQESLNIVKELKRQQSVEMQKFRDIDNEKQKRKKFLIIGDATETAILRYCEIMRQTDDYREKHKKIFELPFNSKNKYQLSIHQTKGNRILVIKGAPEIIFAMSPFYLKNGKENKMNAEFKEDFDKASSMLGRQGERVIGCAYVNLGNDSTKEYSLKENNIPFDKLCFVGLFSLMDPPKKGVAEAVLKARKAGIKVFMITGDHPLTAEAIARKVNIIGEYETIEEIAKKQKCSAKDLDPNIALAGIVTGSELNTFSEEDWKQLILIKRELVFARISPQQKVEIVENLQKMKEVVIVTGDGVNDAIALKKADIGVAMGKEGTDVAKEAAEVIFIDDNFESIVLAIKEGRTLFDNLKKNIAYTLSHCIIELTPILLYVALGLPLAFNSFQMLSVDLGTELGPAISLAYEEAEDDILDRPPRNLETDRLMSSRLLAYSYLEAGMIETFFCFLAYFWVFLDSGLEITEIFFVAPDYFVENSTIDYISNSGRVYSAGEQIMILNMASTAYYVTCVMGQFFNIWMCKTRQQSFITHGWRNSMTNYGVVIEILILLIIVYVPQFQNIFYTVDLEAKYWCCCLGTGFCLILFNESRKYWTRRDPEGKLAKYLMW